MVNAVPRALILKQIPSATEADPILQQVQQCNEWFSGLKPYKHVKDELCMINGILLQGSQIVMPSIPWQANPI